MVRSTGWSDPPGESTYDEPADLILRIAARGAGNAGGEAPGTLGQGPYLPSAELATNFLPRFSDATIEAYDGRVFNEIRVSYFSQATDVDTLPDDSRDAQYAPGANGYYWLLHELGHAFGLDHLNRRSQGGPIFPGLEAIEGDDTLYGTTAGRFGLNAALASVMSYRDLNVVTEASGADPLTPPTRVDPPPAPVGADQGRTGFCKTPAST